MSSEQTNLTPQLEAAEKAVAAVKDPRLREIAFSRILDHLLSSKNSDTSRAASVATRKQTRNQIKASTASTGTSAWLRELVDEGFFAEPKSIKQTLQELSNRSHHLRGPDLTRQIQQLCHGRILRRRKQAPADGGKEVFHWSNW